MNDKSAFPDDVVENFDLVLLANFVHQVVNPLNGVAGTLDNIVEGTIKDENRKVQRMRAARAQLEQCISLVRNLAFLAQGFNKVSDSEKRDVLLPEQIIRSAMFFQEDAAMKGIRITLVEKPEQNRVFAHLDLLNQVFMNIFDNCVKYSKKGTTVEVHQRIQKKTGDAIITIRNVLNSPIDNIGLSNIFDLGYRGQNAKMVVASGTGLGMYICKRIVEEVHSGTLSVQLYGGDSIEFTIKIPGGIPESEGKTHGKNY
jgi:signal transduction histidine kinase